MTLVEVAKGQGINNIIKQTLLVMIVMIFASTRYYYLAMAEDIFLRLLWVIGLILKQVCLAIVFSKNMNNHCYLKHMSSSFIFSNHFFSAQISNQTCWDWHSYFSPGSFGMNT